MGIDDIDRDAVDADGLWADKRGSREVLAQCRVFITDTACDDVFARPLFLGDQTSLCTLNALMHEPSRLNLDLQRLSSSYEEVLLHFSIGVSPAVELVVEYVKMLVEPLKNDIVFDYTSCMMHSLNRLVANYISNIFEVRLVCHRLHLEADALLVKNNRTDGQAACR